MRCSHVGVFTPYRTVVRQLFDLEVVLALPEPQLRSMIASGGERNE